MSAIEESENESIDLSAEEDEKEERETSTVSIKRRKTYSLFFDVIKDPCTSIEDIKKAQAMLKTRGINEMHYKAFHPLVRLRGSMQKMHRSKLTKYMRYIYLNPIEGVLISYKTANKFPHMPYHIVHLNQIKTVEFMRETKWYFSRSHYYMKIESADKTSIFYDDNLDVVNFWVRQIILAKRFYTWLKSLLDVRY